MANNNKTSFQIKLYRNKNTGEMVKEADFIAAYQSVFETQQEASQVIDTPAAFKFSDKYEVSVKGVNKPYFRFMLLTGLYDPDIDVVRDHLANDVITSAPSFSEELKPEDLLIVQNLEAKNFHFVVPANRTNYVQHGHHMTGGLVAANTKLFKRPDTFRVLPPKLALDMALKFFNPEGLDAAEYVNLVRSNKLKNLCVEYNGVVFPRLPSAFLFDTFPEIEKLLAVKKRSSKPSSSSSSSSKPSSSKGGSGNNGVFDVTGGNGFTVPGDDLNTDELQDDVSPPVPMNARKRSTPTLPNSGGAQESKKKADEPVEKTAKRQRAAPAAESKSKSKREVHDTNIDRGQNIFSESLLGWNAIMEKLIKNAEQWITDHAVHACQDIKKSCSVTPKIIDGSSKDYLAIQTSFLSDPTLKNAELTVQQWGMLGAIRSMVDEGTKKKWMDEIFKQQSDIQSDFVKELLYPQRASHMPSGPAKGTMATHGVLNAFSASVATFQTLELLKPLMEDIQQTVSGSFASLVNEQNTLEESRSAVRSENRKLSQEAENQKSVIAALREQVASLKTQNNQLQSDYDVLLSEKVEAQSQIKDLEEQLANAKAPEFDELRI